MDAQISTAYKLYCQKLYLVAIEQHDMVVNVLDLRARGARLVLKIVSYKRNILPDTLVCAPSLRYAYRETAVKETFVHTSNTCMILKQ